MPLQHITQQLQVYIMQFFSIEPKNYQFANLFPQENLMHGYVLNRKDEDVNKTKLVDTHKKQDTNSQYDNRHDYYYTQPAYSSKISYDHGPYDQFSNFVNR
jgi:hypothetical protein